MTTAPRVHSVSGALRLLLADGLFLPTGLITAAYLTRTLQAADYGTFTLAATLIAWLSQVTSAMLSRTTNLVVSGARGPSPEKAEVVSALFRGQLLTSGSAAFAVFVGAGLLARLFNQAELAFYFRVFALEVLLLGAAVFHRDVLIGAGRTQQRANVSATRWLSRMIFILVLVQAGFGVLGAIVGSMLATIAELSIARRYVRPSPRGGGRIPAQLWSLIGPLVGYGLAMRLFHKLDLFAVKAFGGSAADAGFYGAAQNLASAGSLLTLSLVPLLLSNLVSLNAHHHVDQSRGVARNAIRAALMLLPMAAAAHGASTELMALLFGAPFAASAGVLSVLVYAECALILCGVCTSILVAYGAPYFAFSIAGTMLASAAVGHMVAVPRLGSLGAAATTAVVAIAGATVALAAARRRSGLQIPAATLARAVSIAPAAWWLASVPAATGVAIIGKLVLVTIAVAVAYALSGEIAPSERRQFYEWLRRRDPIRR